MANYRKSRINGEITREMASIIRDVKDPRVSEAMLCITGADCSADLKQCKIYYSSLLSAENAPEIKKGLKSANGFIRSQLAKRLNLRTTPELHYILDTSVENGAHISSILRKIDEELEARTIEEKNEEDKEV